MNEKLWLCAQAELSSAGAEIILNRAAEQGIELRCLESLSPCSIRLMIREGDIEALDKICRACGSSLEIISPSKIKRGIAGIRGRAALFSLLLALIMLLGASAFFIWDIELKGAEGRERELRCALSEAGLNIGSFSPGLSPELIRSELLKSEDYLASLNISFEGSRALISASLRPEAPEIKGTEGREDIIALRGGKIISMDIFRGLPLCSVGEQVEEGQLLVSGHMESITAPPREERAKAVIMAETEREISLVAPSQCRIKGRRLRRRLRWAVKFGKKRWNLYFCSGKSIDGCDKIITEYKLGIEGLFALPVSLIREELIERDSVPGPVISEAELRAAAMRRAEGETAGRVLRAEFRREDSPGLTRLILSARLLEDIAVKAP